MILGFFSFVLVRFVYFMMNIKKVKAIVMVMCMVITGIGELGGKLIEWAVDRLKADTYLI